MDCLNHHLPMQNTVAQDDSLLTYRCGGSVGFGINSLTDFPFNPQVVKPYGTLKQVAIITTCVDKASDAPYSCRLKDSFILINRAAKL
jgi:hypothetical protein